MSVTTVESEKQFQETLDENKLVIVDFYTKWCGPCKRIAPQIEELSKEQTNVHFCKLDIDQVEDVASDFGIRSIPTFIAFKSGKPMEKVVGADFNKLVQMVKNLQA